MYRIKFNPKKFKRIPKKAIISWIISLIIFAFSAINALLPANHMLKDLETIQLKIDKVILAKTYNTSGSRRQLYITSGDRKYKLSYPSFSYRQYSEALDTYLLSGSTTVVTAKVIPNSTIRDALGYRTRIVDLRTDNVVFFDIEDEIKDNQINHVAVVFLAFIIGFGFIVYTMLIAMGYGFVEFRKPRKKKKEK